MDRLRLALDLLALTAFVVAGFLVAVPLGFVVAGAAMLAASWRMEDS